jgi:hypothetical protein
MILASLLLARLRSAKRGLSEHEPASQRAIGKISTPSPGLPTAGNLEPRPASQSQHRTTQCLTHTMGSLTADSQGPVIPSPSPLFILLFVCINTVITHGVRLASISTPRSPLSTACVAPASGTVLVQHPPPIYTRPFSPRLPLALEVQEQQPHLYPPAATLHLQWPDSSG